MDIELSCGLPPGPDFADLARLAEELGYVRVWIFDSAPFWEDSFVHLALAATRTTRIGLSTAVLIPTQRSVMTMASALATINRLSGGRLRAAFGTGFTAQFALGRRPMKLDTLVEYMGAVRSLLAGETVFVDGRAARMMHAEGLAAPRPIDVPLWLSVFGPRGQQAAVGVADGIIGRPHPTLPSATMVSGTMLEPGEQRDSPRVRNAVAPWRVTPWHTAYAAGGAAAVDAMPGGVGWRTAVEHAAPESERHLLTFEGHVTHLTERDLPLLEHIDVDHIIGDRAEIADRVAKFATAGHQEVLYTPTGPDVARELRSFRSAVA